MFDINDIIICYYIIIILPCFAQFGERVTHSVGYPSEYYYSRLYVVVLLLRWYCDTGINYNTPMHTNNTPLHVYNNHLFEHRRLRVRLITSAHCICTKAVRCVCRLIERKCCNFEYIYSNIEDDSPSKLNPPPNFSLNN